MKRLFIYFFSIFLLFSFNNVYSLDQKIITNDEMLNQIIKGIMPITLKNIHLLNVKDFLTIKNSSDSMAEVTYGNYTNAFEEHSIFSYLEGDLKHNNEKEIAAACIDDKNTKGILVIIENHNNNWVLGKYFVFNKDNIIFLVSFTDKMIFAGFEYATGNGVEIIWNGKDFVIKPRDRYGP